MSKHRLKVRLRAFAIWQKLGFMPWSKSRSRSRKGDFYKGAFDTIPFLNDDAKRTFVHLLLRPGYMIRDYIKGQHERYLAPLTSLIIFYAFFALISAVVNPEYSSYHPEASSASRAARDSVLMVSTAQTNPADSLSQSDFNRQQAAVKVSGRFPVVLVVHGVGLIHLLDVAGDGPGLVEGVVVIADGGIEQDPQPQQKDQYQ